MNSSHKLFEHKVFFLSINTNSPFNNYNISGSGFEVSKNNNIVQIFLNLPNEKCLFAELNIDGKFLFFTPSLYRIPIYYRCINETLILSNIVSNIFQPNESIFIDTFTFLRHLTGCPYPVENYFADFTLLDSSSVYSYKKNKLSIQSSLLNGGSSLSNLDALDRISELVDFNFSHGRPVSILLSAGYDSRFNLALAHHYSKKFGNRIKLYHEYKNQDEFEISKRLSESVNLPLTLIDRTTFLKKNDSKIFRENNQIELQSGFYRENLVRWHEYLNWISEDNKDSFIWGLGVETHKGKFYNYINNIDESVNIFSTKINILEIARQSGINNINNSEISYLLDLVEKSNDFNFLSSKIDYVHYHTYCAGFGKRCHDLYQNFNISFPFLDPEFLRIVFSLPRGQKENFKIVKDGIKKYSPSMNKVPYISGNQKSLGNLSKVLKFKNDIRHFIGNHKRACFRQPSTKSNLSLNIIDLEFIKDYSSNSEVTNFLKDLLLGKWCNVSGIQLDYILQSFYYLVLCEAKYNVTFKFK